MKLTWLGHSCFAVESGGYRVVLDPYYVESYPPLRVLCTAAPRIRSNSASKAKGLGRK